jgi:hypothetical protein
MPMRVLRQCLLLALYLCVEKSLARHVYTALGCTDDARDKSSFVSVRDREEFSGDVRGRDGTGIPDGVSSPQTDPLRDGSILLLSLCKLDLGAERLVALFGRVSALLSHTFVSRACASTLATRDISI